MPRSPDLAAAEGFIWRNARLIDRHRYAYFFKGGSAEAVVAALAPYQNADGGFGHGLEPDARGPSSQPTHVHAALVVLDEIGRMRDPVVMRAVDYLASVTTPEGGVPIALPSVREAPKAPWWEVGGEAPVATLLPTAGLAGLLHKHRVEHAWLAPATAFCWNAIGALEQTHPYEVDFCLILLEHVPDRERAAGEAERLRRLVLDGGMVALDPDRHASAHVAPGYAPGEVHTPLDYAPRPSSLARGWFSDDVIERNLDGLAAAQREDGGWMFNWRAWNDATTLEWRGWLTVRALSILAAYGRLPS
ncbi:MAG TPA: hypothetical protein VG370_26365 [Chloroflexota bacterium]|jgi:hypothetical protein|nr:hypothetical protein [Chloroflexota bacterium]